MIALRTFAILFALVALYFLLKIATMRTKASVNLNGLSWRMFWAALKAENVFSKYGAELVITSAVDGKHKNGSLHYEGLALDLRTWDIVGREPSVALDLRVALGDDYDVVIEQDHIHIEYDPSQKGSIA